MNTILTDHELCMAMASADSYDPGNMCRAVEAAVVAKLAQQAPVAEIEVNAAPAGGVTATVWSVHLAPGTYSLHLHPAPQQADRQRVPDWRPIETAPRGEVVLLWSGRRQEVDLDDFGRFAKYNSPMYTHWMPLPTGPDAAAPEAPTQAEQAAEPVRDERELNRLLNDFARACAFGDDQTKRMAASKAIHDLFRARAALAAPEAQAVLIDGATYSIPMPVSVELLRLHMELLQQAEQTKCVPCPTCGANTASPNPLNWCACPKQPAQASAVDERDRKDAERYRWLRDALVSDDPYDFAVQAFGHFDEDRKLTPDDFDACISAALAQKGGK